MLNIEKDDKQTSVKSHSENIRQEGRWDKIYDTLQDESWIKSLGSKYLPVPSGILAEEDTQLKTAMYNSYVSRAIFYRYVSNSIDSMKSLLTKKPVEIQLPEKMKILESNAGQGNDPLHIIIARLFQAQLSYSRYGFLVDIPSGSVGTGVVPHILEYTHNKIVNWEVAPINGKEKLVVLVLDESFTEVKKGLVTERVEKFRICALANIGTENQQYYTYTGDASIIEEFEIDQELPDGVVIPSIMGRTLNYIPFQPCNALGLEMYTEIPFLIAIADMALAIYRGEADYRQSLYQQGVATPYVTGTDVEANKITYGASNLVVLNDANAKAGFIEVSGKGLNGMKLGLDGLHTQQEKLGVSLINAGANQSSEALSIRLGIQTASLAGLSATNKKCIESVLGFCADWMGSNRDEIKLTYSTDFVNVQKPVDELEKLAKLVNLGNFTVDDYFDYLNKNEFTTFLNSDEWKNALEVDGLGLIDADTNSLIDSEKAKDKTDEPKQKEVSKEKKE